MPSVYNLVSENLLFLKDFNFESNNFVAIYNDYDEKSFDHAGILIYYNQQLLKFHFDNDGVHLDDITENYEYHRSTYKILQIINPLEVSVFKGHCEIINKSSRKPEFGYIFGEGYYNTNSGNNIVEGDNIDITTCVGFCIKVIRGFLYNHSEYLNLEDWDESSINEGVMNKYRNYASSYCRVNNLNIEEFLNKETMKRILPLEILSSGYFTELAIRKEQTDDINPIINSIISKTFEIELIDMPNDNLLN